MTEAEWWGATDPFSLIAELIPPASDRKGRLFSLACCRLLERHLKDWPCGVFVNVLEEFAEGILSPSSVPDRLDSDALEYGPGSHVLRNSGLRDEADHALSTAFHSAPEGLGYPIVVTILAEDILQRLGLPGSELLVSRIHDLFGPLPFRDIAADPNWLTSTVVAIAHGIYDDKAFDRLPVLADALEDAGCANDEILSHCRAVDREHVRGCWVVDLLLGRPWRE